jgi:hypothetical protein
VDYSDAMTACVNCGRVLEDAAFASDVTFMKGADGDGELVGQMVGSDGNVRGLQRMAGGKVWSSRVSVCVCVCVWGGGVEGRERGSGVKDVRGFGVGLSWRAHDGRQGGSSRFSMWVGGGLGGGVSLWVSVLVMTAT